jgi:hypothetical protein
MTRVKSMTSIHLPCQSRAPPASARSSSTSPLCASVAPNCCRLWTRASRRIYSHAWRELTRAGQPGEGCLA